MMKILISVAVALLLVGCSSDTKQQSEEVKQEIVEKTENIKQEIVEKTENIKDEVVEKTENIKDEVVEKTENIKDKVVDKTQEIQKEVVAKVEDVKQVALAQISGAALYQVCAGCHGTDASKAALGKSQIIKGWDAKKIAGALHGYKAGTYGGAMKSVMAGQVSKLSDEDIKILSEHISKL
ncbi:MAG: hypothetical protein A3E21_03090 [Sulfurimonas sp. RIFCSPHIGHO2_12_FULL_36_9]|nr:MAG: hypothetical protein A3E21_03090 [Sulfurimonas sp. RIFCSPHIGHO2_12_FULL_36_9]OHD98922.1 MAG: hypothetical protein A3J26_00275 [Sulfurimonas sp. RIFCSPLOWO2_02_FULL_36_28]OHE02359.1 MAG: hypothetical protein A2W82_09695 [Sulfurimonas sp. RIFCSPLOWO2_12_36_12]OHE04554.1 MAG: hypothetical protein A3K14_03175 [Sulfurimonas sp. RIFCSPLOWO2_12_FULL_36_74]